MNPVNPNDNLADSWNYNLEKAELFFKWVKVMKKDYLDSLCFEDNDFVALLENNFGSDYVKKNISEHHRHHRADEGRLHPKDPRRRVPLRGHGADGAGHRLYHRRLFGGGQRL